MGLLDENGTNPEVMSRECYCEQGQKPTKEKIPLYFTGVARLMMKARILAEVLIQLTESSTCMSENPEIQPFPTAVRGALLTMGQVISPWNKPFPPTVRGSLLTIGQVISGTLRVTTARLTYKNSIRAETRTEREGGSTGIDFQLSSLYLHLQIQHTKRKIHYSPFKELCEETVKNCIIIASSPPP
ncbi:uncharacterized protein LOC143662379 isoform X2 [Tamandua tetradactyla]|uniref:uncharacterized protein LOC143662379 isoform X2 n=1 Tax=Tamandua tetradactyla TaxID=48850 RepID=UPI0040544DB7